MNGMVEVKSWIRCESNGEGGQMIDRDGDPREIIDMAFRTAKWELADNMQLFHYARYVTRQMFRELWKQSDTHEKFMYLLDKLARGFFAVLAGLGGIVLVGWCITAVERLVLG